MSQDPDKWLEDYKKDLADLMRHPHVGSPIRGGSATAIKKRMNHIDDMWRILPPQHKRTIMEMCEVHAHQGASNPYC